MSAERNAPITEMIAATRAMRDNAEGLAKDCRARGDKSLAAEWAAVAYERARFVRMLEGLRDDIGTDEPCATRIDR